jgi:hypothetical protein
MKIRYFNIKKKINENSLFQYFLKKLMKTLYFNIF